MVFPVSDSGQRSRTNERSGVGTTSCTSTKPATRRTPAAPVRHRSSALSAARVRTARGRRRAGLRRCRPGGARVRRGRPARTRSSRRRTRSGPSRRASPSCPGRSARGGTRGPRRRGSRGPACTPSTRRRGTAPGVRPRPVVPPRSPPRSHRGRRQSAACPAGTKACTSSSVTSSDRHAANAVYGTNRDSFDPGGYTRKPSGEVGSHVDSG